MPSILTTPPAIEPVTLAEAKAHLRIAHADDDEMLARLIAAGRRHLESRTGLCLISQTWSCYRDQWPDGPEVDLPVAPLLSVSAIHVYGEDDVAAELDAAHYVVDRASRPARLVLRASRLWPLPGRSVNGIEIVAVAGFGPAATDVPPLLRQALLELVAHWYANRGEVAAPLPLNLSALINSFREVRL